MLTLNLFLVVEFCVALTLRYNFHHPTKMKSDISSRVQNSFARLIYIYIYFFDILTLRCGKAKGFIACQTTLIISIIIFGIPRLIWGK